MKAPHKNTFKNMTAKGFNRLLWIIFIVPFVIIIILFSLISLGKLGYMPTFQELENPKMNVASQVITQDSVVMHKLFLPRNNRINVEYNDLSPYVVNALLATEDIRFYKHSGIDARGLARAVFYLGKRGGASTITQQLAKQLFHTPASNFIERLWQKLNEWVIAVKLEKKYTKEEIMAMYLNIFDFNHLAIGIQSASQIYFNTTPDSLLLQEAATLVGMLQNPVLFDPTRDKFYDTTVFRRNMVMHQMVKYNYLEKQIFDSISALPIELHYNKVDHNEGVGVYFREYVKKILMANKPIKQRYYSYDQFVEDSISWLKNPVYGWCNKNLKPNGEPYNIYSDGLKIYTTVNYKMQKYAEEAIEKYIGGYLQDEFFKEKKGQRYAPFPRKIDAKVYNDYMWRYMRTSIRGRRLREQGYKKKEIIENFKKPVPMTLFSWAGDKDTVLSPYDSIRYFKHILRCGFISIEPTSGEVRTYVGGPNYRYFKYDNATQGKRQAGSTFKPFLYILAMQQGLTPCYKVRVVEQTFIMGDTIYTPRTTARDEDIGTLKTLKWGLAHSENYISAWLVKNFKPQPIANIAHKMGVTSYIDPVPSMIYGPSVMSVMEMVSAYTTLANKGIHTMPIVITRIEDKFGNLLADFKSTGSEAISEETAYLMLNLMEGVTNNGSARRLRHTYNFDAKIASKTGTTNNNADSWFIGITPNLVSGCWVGGDNMYFRFENNFLGQGALSALPVWGEFMTRVYADSSLNITQKDEFEPPANFIVNLDCDEIGNGQEIQEFTDENVTEIQ